MISKLKPTTRSFLYALLHPWVSSASRVFYRKFRVEGLENFPKNGTPTILISNHQNGLMDPLLCCLIAPRQVHFLTRADIFRKPFIRSIMTGMNMMPIFRQHDRVPDMIGMNQRVFEICIERLRRGAVIGLFPEGNHGNKKVLRPFKKGMARLVYLAQETHPELANIQVVPFGLDYSSYEAFQSDITVRIGKPISLHDWFAEHPNDPKNQSGLMHHVRGELLKSIYDLRPSGHYKLLAEALVLLEQTTKSGFEENKLKIQALGRYIDGDDNNGPQLEHTLEKVKTSLAALKAGPHDLFVQYNHPILRAIALLFLLPFTLCALVIHGIPYALTAYLVKNMIKDPHFKSSFKLIIGLLSFTLFHGIVFGAVGANFGWRWGLVYLLSALVCGNFGLIFRRMFRAMKLNYRTSKWKKQNARLWTEAQAWKKELFLRMTPKHKA
jgi:1-acyl-sn-glycerol-3-phosphate acyltransferase